MSWRFRRVISGGPFRLNLSRSGIGWSVGIPGMRYGRSATGAPYVSLGFPRLGLYWFKYLRDCRSSERRITSTTSSEPSRAD
jgi:Protein of unknown function (DUF4236)